MAIWLTGITWAPPSQTVDTNWNGALDHVARHFASWICCLARAVTLHKEDPSTVQARIRSGNAFGKHGLTPQELQNRCDRCTAQRNYYWAKGLNNQVQASKGKGKVKVKHKSFEQMSYNNKWWLQRLWDGHLRTALDEAKQMPPRPSKTILHPRKGDLISEVFNTISRQTNSVVIAGPESLIQLFVRHKLETT